MLEIRMPKTLLLGVQQVFLFSLTIVFGVVHCLAPLVIAEELEVVLY